MAAPAGNKNAVKAKVWSDALRKEIVQGDNLKKLARALIDKALDGDVSAIREIGDRLEGKPLQGIDIDGVVDHTLTVEIIRFGQDTAS
jgi:hypothetical protein